MEYPVIDLEATGRRIDEARIERGLKIADISEALGLATTYAVYKWVRGKTLPALENLVALGRLLDRKIDDLIVIR